MREIRFRAWNGEEMIYEGGKQFMGYRHSYEILQSYETIMQFTGLKDKNGVEIYEGDITQYHYLKNYTQQSHYGVRPEIDEMIIAKASDVVVFKNGCFIMSKDFGTDKSFPYLTPISEYGLFSMESVKEDIFGEMLEYLSEEEQSGDCDGTDINESIIGIEVIGNIYENPELIK